MWHKVKLVAGTSMASRWIVCKQGDSLLRFGELVALARSGEVTEEDLVKAEWENEWRPAHTVVGLFYSVRREAASAPLEMPAGSASPCDSQTSSHDFSFDDLDHELLQDAEAPASEVTEVGWQRRIRELATFQSTTEQEVKSHETSEVRLLVEAALMEADTTAATSRSDRFLQTVERAWSAIWSMTTLWLGAGLVLAGMICWAVLTYSRMSAYRFPKAGYTSGYVLPIFGNLTAGDLWLIVRT